MIRRGLLFTMLAVFLLGAMALGAEPTTFSVYYDPVGLTTTPIDSLSATAVGKGVTGLRLTRGPGINAAGLTNGFSADGWNLSDPSRTGSLNAGAYFQFGLTVQPGYSASLTTLDMPVRRSAASSPMNMELQVSIDGFATPGISVTTFNYYGRTSGTSPAQDPTKSDPFYYMHSDLPGRPNETTSPGDHIPTIDLTKISALQNLPSGTVVTFRLYAWGNNNTTATNTLAFGRMTGPRIAGVVEAK